MNDFIEMLLEGGESRGGEDASFVATFEVAAANKEATIGQGAGGVNVVIKALNFFAKLRLTSFVKREDASFAIVTANKEATIG